MYKNEREWLKAIKNDDLQATVERLQATRLPDVPRSPQLIQTRRKLLARQTEHRSWLPLLQRGAGAMVGFLLLVLLVGFFWLNQGNQTATSPGNVENTANSVVETVPEEAVAPISAEPEITTEEALVAMAVVTETAVIPTDQVWWLAIRRQLIDRNTNLTPYEIEVGYKLENVATATAQVFLAPQNWQTLADLYPFSDPVTISAEDDSVTFTLNKELDQFFQEIPPRASSLVIALSDPEANSGDAPIATAVWKNFVDTEYFAGPIDLPPATDSALNVFDWEFDNDFFAVESPPRRFGGTEIVTFVVNYHYQLTQTSRAYIKLVLVDKTHGNRRLDTAFVRADAGVGLITAYLEFDPALVDGNTSLAIESFIVRDGLESPAQTAGGWQYTPSQ